MTANLFSSPQLAGASINKVRNQFVPTTWFLFHDNLSPPQNGDFTNRFHECIFHVLGPHLLRLLLAGIPLLLTMPRELRIYGISTEFLATVRGSKAGDGADRGEFSENGDGRGGEGDVMCCCFLEGTFFGWWRGYCRQRGGEKTHCWLVEVRRG